MPLPTDVISDDDEPIYTGKFVYEDEDGNKHSAFIDMLRKIDDLTFILSGHLSEALTRSTQFQSVATSSKQAVDAALLDTADLSLQFVKLTNDIAEEKRKSIARVRYILGANDAFFLDKARLMNLDDPLS